MADNIDQDLPDVMEVNEVQPEEEGGDAEGEAAAADIQLPTPDEDKAIIDEILASSSYEFQKNLYLRTIREVVFSDNILPATVYLFGVSTDRRVGSYTTSLWLINFSNLNDVRLVSGTDSFPRIPFDPAVRKQYKMYLEAKKCLGSFLPGQDNGINYTSYIDGYGIIAWDLSRSGNPHLPDMPRLANLELHMDYSAVLTEATSYILVMEYNSNIYSLNPVL